MRKKDWKPNRRVYLRDMVVNASTQRELRNGSTTAEPPFKDNRGNYRCLVLFDDGRIREIMLGRIVIQSAV
jgi:hypothetical protein